MSKILILGANGSLGRHVVQQAVAANHSVSAVARRAPELPAEIHEKVIVHQADLSKMPTSALASLFQDHEVVINTAGNVTQGQGFVDLVGHIVTGLEAVPETSRPVCWFLAGAGLLDIDGGGRKGVDLPMISTNYWPHCSNFDRIRRTDLDWRILCLGPMTDQRSLGLARMRISLDRLPIEMPDDAESLSEQAGRGCIPEGYNHFRHASAEQAQRGILHVEMDGKEAIPEARDLLICADSGGSNGYRSHLWKRELQKLANWGCPESKGSQSCSRRPCGTCTIFKFHLITSSRARHTNDESAAEGIGIIPQLPGGARLLPNTKLHRNDQKARPVRD